MYSAKISVPGIELEYLVGFVAWVDVVLRELHVLVRGGVVEPNVVARLEQNRRVVRIALDALVERGGVVVVPDRTRLPGPDEVPPAFSRTRPTPPLKRPIAVQSLPVNVPPVISISPWP